MEAYRGHPYRRDLPEMPALWQQGSSRLLDYAPAAAPDAPAILVVPSLVNRYYVLDLDEKSSLLRWLAAEGFRPFVLDWGAPGEAERGFTLTDYVAGRLEAALDALLESQRGPLHLAGYCMGGLLALALAARRGRDLSSLTLLATPWDFHAEQAETARLVGLQASFLAPLLETLGVMPTDVVQSYFALLDPLSVLRKFMAFARLDHESEKARRFVALEDWLNDGVPLAARVASECLCGWYGRNEPAAGLWRIAGQPVDPGAIDLPSLALVPAQDRIVPPRSALALAAGIPGAEILQPPLGHIGMVVAGRAPELAWRPLADWLAKRGP
jgi:polyhydroxyalkanoate synthase